MTTRIQKQNDLHAMRGVIHSLETTIQSRDNAIKAMAADIDRLNVIISELSAEPEQVTHDIATIVKTALRQVYHYFDDSILTTKSRRREFVEPRQMFMCLMAEHSTLPLAAIADYCGHRDHTTAIYARDHIRDLVGSSKDIREKYNRLKVYIKKQTKEREAE